MVKNLVIAASLAIVLNILFFNWIFHDDVVNHGQDIEYIKAGIQHLDIQIENDDVLLNVKLIFIKGLESSSPARRYHWLWAIF